MQERLAELAYNINHDLGGEVEHIEENTGSLAIDDLRRSLDEFTLRQGLS